MTIARSSTATGISSTANRGSPILTFAHTTVSPSHEGVTSRSPARVSTRTGEVSLGTMPRVSAKPTRQRMPFPHISASDPSALNILMRRSAWSDSSARIRPSAPIPVWRSLSLADIAGQSSSLRAGIDVDVVVACAVHLGELQPRPPRHFESLQYITPCRRRPHLPRVHAPPHRLRSVFDGLNEAMSFSGGEPPDALIVGAEPRSLLTCKTPGLALD